MSKIAFTKQLFLLFLLLIFINPYSLINAQANSDSLTIEADSNSSKILCEKTIEDNMIKMVLVKPGKFKFGSGVIESDDESEEVEEDEEYEDEDIELDETPAFMAEITYPFWIGSYEVTQEQYSHIMNENPSFFIGKNLPVEQVTWRRAALFCNLLSEKCGYQKCYDEINWKCDITKNGFRLPTEAEWVYACGYGANGSYFFEGDPEVIMNDYAVFDDGKNLKKEPLPVGSKKPNLIDLYDMYGNVFEWCNDFYSDELNSEESVNPTGLNVTDSDNYSSSGVPFKVLKGGGWGSFYYDCRTQNRGSGDPLGGYDDVGFRVVRTCSQQNEDKSDE